MTVAKSGRGDTKGDVRAKTKYAWSEEEDNLLREAIGVYGEGRWTLVATMVPGRDSMQCSQHWKKVLDPTLVKGFWTPLEDSKLLELKTDPAQHSWKEVSDAIGTRSAKQCRERWNNTVNPALKRGRFTIEEDKLMLDLWRKYGSRWSVIAEHLPGRTQTKIRDRFKTLKNHNKAEIEAWERKYGKHGSSSVRRGSVRSSGASRQPVAAKLVVAAKVKNVRKRPSGHNQPLARWSPNEVFGSSSDVAIKPFVPPPVNSARSSKRQRKIPTKFAESQEQQDELDEQEEQPTTVQTGPSLVIGGNIVTARMMENIPPTVLDWLYSEYMMEGGVKAQQAQQVSPSTVTDPSALARQMLLAQLQPAMLQNANLVGVSLGQQPVPLASSRTSTGCPSSPESLVLDDEEMPNGMLNDSFLLW